MAKEVKAFVKLQIPAGGATPAPPVGSALGPHGLNIMEFCKAFNAQTANRKGELIKKKSNVTKGSSRPYVDKVGTISWAAVEEIANIKMPDLNAVSMDEAKKIVAGTARSMGIDVV